MLSFDSILAQKSMDDTVDLTGDGGVLKTIIRKPRHDELAPSDSIPVVDGKIITLIFYSNVDFFFYHFKKVMLKISGNMVHKLCCFCELYFKQFSEKVLLLVF